MEKTVKSKEDEKRREAAKFGRRIRELNARIVELGTQVERKQATIKEREDDIDYLRTMKQRQDRKLLELQFELDSVRQRPPVVPNAEKPAAGNAVLAIQAEVAATDKHPESCVALNTKAPDWNDYMAVDRKESQPKNVHGFIQCHTVQIRPDELSVVESESRSHHSEQKPQPETKKERTEIGGPYLTSPVNNRRLKEEEQLFRYRPSTTQPGKPEASPRFAQESAGIVGMQSGVVSISILPLEGAEKTELVFSLGLVRVAYDYGLLDVAAVSATILPPPREANSKASTVIQPIPEEEHSVTTIHRRRARSASATLWDMRRPTLYPWMGLISPPRRHCATPHPFERRLVVQEETRPSRKETFPPECGSPEADVLPPGEIEEETSEQFPQLASVGRAQSVDTGAAGLLGRIHQLELENAELRRIIEELQRGRRAGQVPEEKEGAKARPTVPEAKADHAGGASDSEDSETGEPINGKYGRAKLIVDRVVRGDARYGRINFATGRAVHKFITGLCQDLLLLHEAELQSVDSAFRLKRAAVCWAHNGE